MFTNGQSTHLYEVNIEKSTSIPIEFCELLAQELIRIIIHSIKNDETCPPFKSAIGVIDAIKLLDDYIPQIYDAHACPANSQNISQTKEIKDFCNGMMKIKIFNKELYNYLALKISLQSKFEEESQRRYLVQK
jgi:hypothetical protein